MDTGLDLTTASREALLAFIARQQASILELQGTVAEQQAVIIKLQRRIESLEGKAKPGGPPRMPGIKPKSGQGRPEDKGPRKPRPHGFARQRMTPTNRVEHVLESCSECGSGLAGGWVQRTREVIDIPVVPFQVTEQVFIARICPVCERRRVPQADLNGVAVGRQRLGVNLVSLITALREEGRLPVRAVQWYLRTVHQLHLSVGAIVGVTHGVAQRAQPVLAQVLAQVLDRIRASPVVHADETGWRQNGANGYVWTFTTPAERYFLRRGRNKEVVDEALGESFSGVLVSDFYAAYNHYPGPKQRCWAHLLRDIHDLGSLYPKDQKLARWAADVHRLWELAKEFTHPKAKQRQAKQRRLAQDGFEQAMLARCQPFLEDSSAVQNKLCRRIEKHIKELFVFVAEAEAPSDNNAAERSLRHLVISRKISGGTRLQQGTETKMTLPSIFGTWRAQSLNPLQACREMLVSPQV